MIRVFESVSFHLSLLVQAALSYMHIPGNLRFVPGELAPGQKH